MADFWSEHFGPYVKDTKTMEEFAEGLKKARYNSVNPKYYDHLASQLKTIKKFKIACGIE